MYVCHCNVVTDRDILESIANGARCVADVARETGAGRTCGNASARSATSCVSIARSEPSESRARTGSGWCSPLAPVWSNCSTMR